MLVVDDAAEFHAPRDQRFVLPAPPFEGEPHQLVEILAVNASRRIGNKFTRVDVGDLVVDKTVIEVQVLIRNGIAFCKF